MNMKNTQLNNSGRSTDKIGYYFLIGTKELLVITVRGIIYNVGLLGRPYLRGQACSMPCRHIYRQ